MYQLHEPKRLEGGRRTSHAGLAPERGISMVGYVSHVDGGAPARALDEAARIADAVLYEGHPGHPGHRPAAKDHLRWQFGLLTPKSWGERSGEPWFAQTECLLVPAAGAMLHVRLRGLQLDVCTVEAGPDAEGLGFRPVDELWVDDRRLVPWDEGVPRQVDTVVPLDQLRWHSQTIPFRHAGERGVELVMDAGGRVRGRLSRRGWPVDGRLRLSLSRAGGRYGTCRLQVVAENLSARPGAGREAALRRSLLATHLILAVSAGEFVSLLDPPEWARPAAARCVNLHTWPVLVGSADRRDVVLSSPIILYDHPELAPESRAGLG